MSAHERETELEQALRTARDITKNQVAYRETFITLARAFLAQHERVAALEAERDAARTERDDFRARYMVHYAARLAAESRLAQARVEGAREALTRLQSWWTDVEHRSVSSGTVARNVASFRDREYPATREEPTPAEPSPVGGERTHCGCWADRAPNEPCVCPATPQAAPDIHAGGPVVVFESVEMSDGGYKVLLTPADCQRIVETARAARPTGEG